MALSDEEKRAKKNAYMRKWKRRNKEKVNAINRAVKAKSPDLYREINRRSMAKMRAQDPQRFLELALSHRKRFVERYMLTRARQRAMKRGAAFDITIDDIVVPERCPVFGVPLEFEIGNRGARNHWAPSLDRHNPEKGYVKGNVRVISNRANRLKNNGTLKEFRQIVAYLERDA